jgi:hypothetical protein
MKRFIWIAAPAALAAIGLAPSSALGIVNWSNPTGSTPLFTWAGGYEDNGFYGDPTATVDSLIFTPSSFFAINPGNPSITDTLHVNITVQPGHSITDVTIFESGTRTSTGLTTIIGTLHLYDLTVGGTTDITRSLVYTNGPGSAWSGTATASSLGFGQGVTFHLDLTNSMTALVGGQNIHKNNLEIHFPAPGTLGGMAGMAVLALGRRRRAR